jgi:hypothetical protein
MTWFPPEGLTLAKSRKAAKTAAESWEEEVRRDYLAERETALQANTETEEGSRYTFDSFVNNVWLPLHVCDGSLRVSTVAFYKDILWIAMPHFQGVPLNDISAVKINQYLAWLRSD